MTKTDLELARLLCTRLCHDLAGPISAVAAGAELVGDDPSQADEEALALIGDSSAAASRKLKFMRAALGLANGPVEDFQGLLDGYLGTVAGMDGKVGVIWPELDELSIAENVLGPTCTHLLLNLCLLGLEIQPGCKKMSLSVSANPLPLTIEVDVSSNPSSNDSPNNLPALQESMLRAIEDPDIIPVTVKTVQAYETGKIVHSLGGTVTCSFLPQSAKVSASFLEPIP